MDSVEEHRRFDADDVVRMGRRMRAGPAGRLLLAAALACAGSVPWAQTSAARVSGGADPQASEPVYTQGEFRATSQDAQGRRFAHIKLAPGRKIPFTTLTYRVLDAALLAGLEPGTAVEFRAEARDGGNVLTAIRAVSPCGTGPSRRCK